MSVVSSGGFAALFAEKFHFSGRPPIRMRLCRRRRSRGGWLGADGKVNFSAHRGGKPQERFWTANRGGVTGWPVDVVKADGRSVRAIYRP